MLIIFILLFHWASWCIFKTFFGMKTGNFSNDKTILNKVDEWLQSKEFGTGRSSISAYETAWAAMLRKQGEPNELFFPESLNWIRRKQMSDGSWGAEFPYSIFDRIISTMIAIICLKESDIKSDQEQIDDGLKFIEINLPSLEFEFEKMRNMMTFAFENIFPKLVDNAEQLGLKIGHDSIVEMFKKEKSIKIEKILKSQKSLSLTSCIWLMALEGCGELYTNEQLQKLIDPGISLINCSYSASIFALKRGVVSHETIKTLSKCVKDNNGGVPIYYNLDIFDLAWSIGYLIWAGYSIKSPLLKPHIDRLEIIWKKTEGVISAASPIEAFTADVDTLSMVIFVLSSDKRIEGLHSLKTMMTYYNTNNFTTWSGEKRVSFSANLHVLNALKNYQDEESVVEVRKNVYNWLKKEIISHNFEIQDKFHFSQYYFITRALIALDYIEPEFSDKIFRFILNKQNEDGGWGTNTSSVLETSMVVISINYWNKTFYHGNDKDALFSIKKAKTFLGKMDHQDLGKFWLAKSLYSPETIDKTIIVAADYVLEKNYQ